jgi:hypothetical protein
MSTTVRRALASIGLAGAVAAVGAIAGALWYQAFGPPWGKFGSSFEGWTEVLGGAATGTLTGAFAGWLLVGRDLRHLGALFVLGGSLISAILFVLAFAQIGDLTNADGPTALSVAITVLGGLGAVAVLGMISRLSRARRSAVKTPRPLQSSP